MKLTLTIAILTATLSGCVMVPYDGGRRSDGYYEGGGYYRGDGYYRGGGKGSNDRYYQRDRADGHSQ